MKAWIKALVSFGVLGLLGSVLWLSVSRLCGNAASVRGRRLRGWQLHRHCPGAQRVHLRHRVHWHRLRCL